MGPHKLRGSEAYSHRGLPLSLGPCPVVWRAWYECPLVRVWPLGRPSSAFIASKQINIYTYVCAYREWVDWRKSLTMASTCHAKTAPPNPPSLSSSEIRLFLLKPTCPKSKCLKTIFHILGLKWVAFGIWYELNLILNYFHVINKKIKILNIW